jgi:hypothetical protein
MDTESNLAVIEVKTIRKVEEASNAVGNLRKFLSEDMHYGYGILLIFGDQLECPDLPAKLPKHDKRIVVLWHRWEAKAAIQWGGPKLW